MQLVVLTRNIWLKILENLGVSIPNIYTTRCMTLQDNNLIKYVITFQVHHYAYTQGVTRVNLVITLQGGSFPIRSHILFFLIALFIKVT